MKMRRGRSWTLAIGLLVIGAVGGACSSGGSGSSGTGGSAGSDAAGTAGAAGSGNAGGGPVQGAGGAAGAAFWCSDYRQADAMAGWIQLEVDVSGVGFGPMTSPIQTCTLGATDWSVAASGTEADGVDQTTMNFAIAGGYHGPGRYQGGVAQGFTGSISHDDLGSFAFTTGAASDCTFCINADGRSGTVSCWDLEPPPGASTDIAYVTSGSFTCPNALAKPADAPTDPAPTGGLGGAADGTVLCHYLAKLGCAGRPDDATCLQHVAAIAINGPCPDQWTTWLDCAQGQPPAQFTCGMGDDLVMSSGACAAELTALRSCRGTH